MKMEKIMKCNEIMNHLQDLWHQKIVGFYEEHGISLIKIEILVILATKEKITLYEIAKMINKPTSNVSPTLRKMANQDLLIKKNSQSDRRIVYFTISEKGQEVLEESKKFFSELADKLITEEFLLDNLYNSLQQYIGMIKNNL